MNPVTRHLLQAVVWSGYVAVSLAMLATYMALTSGIVVMMCAVGAGLWLASETLRAWALRWHWLDLPPRALALRALVAPVLLAVLVQIAVALLARLLVALAVVEFAPRSVPSLGAMAGYVANTSILLWLWFAAWSGRRYLRRWRHDEVAKWQAQAQQRALELEVLRAQINPHFLFNALNNLRALISEDAEKAREMVTRLSNILRHTLVHSGRERVPLAEELALVRDYLALEQVHYEERLRVVWQIAPGVEALMVPPMILQLLVENALKHGIAKTPGGGELRIELARDAGRLRIAVDNPGCWAPATPGIGLSQVTERLARAGGEGAECRITSDNGRVRVTLSLAVEAS